MVIDKNSKVLIVDDSRAVRGVVGKILAQLGYTDVDQAVDGSDALQKINAARYGLVISDWNMQPMNGEELLENLRAQDRFAKLPVIMMTTEPSVEKLAKARQARVSSFIVKPFDPEALQAKILQFNTN
jgi:two-component system, chemotaxis family, chemotaxis protein CheY